MDARAKRIHRRGKASGTLTLDLARVLVVDDDPTSRLTLQTVLEAGGYSVDVASSAAEAFGKLDHAEYQLVLSDMDMESPEAGLRVLQHARMMNYKPATALVTAYRNCRPNQRSGPMLIEPEDLPDLLAKVASLIGERVSRQVARELRQIS
jgi:CheY-like chemotaxis protein